MTILQLMPVMARPKIYCTKIIWRWKHYTC